MNRPPHGSVRGVNLGSDYTDDETEFLLAMERYQRERRRPYPTYAEVLAVAKSLGYRRVEDGSDSAVPAVQGPG